MRKKRKSLALTVSFLLIMAVLSGCGTGERICCRGDEGTGFRSGSGRCGDG